MSVEDIKRVNELAQELLNQGIASSREDAIKQAELMLNKKLAEPVNGENRIVVKDDLEYYKNIIQRNKEYMERQLNNFRQEIDLLNKEINVLKEQLANLTAKGESRTVQESDLSEKKVSEVAEKPESHPKKGKFKPEDVAIEKVFYYGNK